MCNGTNGTPDLRNRFLEEVGNYTVGTYLDPGLPNITGEFITHVHTYNHTGAFSKRSGYENSNNSFQETSDSGIIFDASKCDQIYGKATTVQPAAYTVYFIIRIK